MNRLVFENRTKKVEEKETVLSNNKKNHYIDLI